MRRGENNRRRLSPRARSCDGWAKEMVEKPDVDGDLVGLDDVGLRIGNLKKPIANCLMMPYLSLFKPLTVCVTRVWVGVDFVWEQEKPEARKKLENAADSHTSGARCVRRF